MATAIEFNHISKQYRLGLVSTRTLSHDLDRWFQTTILRREDPYLKIGEVNDRASKGNSEYVWALRDIDFKVEQGDVVGIIGKNGAGKSTLLKLLSKVTAPTTGTIRAKGRIASLLEVGTGFHQEMTGRENIYMNGAILGMTKQEISRKLDEIVDFSGCERYIDTPVKRYSSGMMVRLGFAVAAHLDPEILVVDEVLAVGDAEFQKKAIGKMNDISRGEGRTVLFVSHNMGSIRALCTRGVLLENGTVKFRGGINSVIDQYITDSVFVPGRILDNLKTHTAGMKIDEFLINSREENLIKIDNEHHLIEIDIKGSISTDQIIELEVQIFDEMHLLLASFCPCHVLSRCNRYEVGRFIIHEKFDFPANITAGKYFMDIQLTHPNVTYHTSLTQCIEIDSEGIPSIVGNRLAYKNVGMLLLN